MNGIDYTPALASLSAEEGVFTTAQAARFDIPRDVLARAYAAGKIERVTRGAYRAAYVASSYLDEIVAAWKLTAPSKLTWERMVCASWDGVAVGGATASALNGIGDFYLTPIRMYSQKRFNTRNPGVSVAIRHVDREDVDFEHGFAATRMERTLIDLVLDDEELSLVQDAYEDAADKGLDVTRLRGVVSRLTVRERRKVEAAFEEGGLHGL